MICSYWSMIKFVLHINTELIFVLGSAVVSVTKKMILFKMIYSFFKVSKHTVLLTIYRLHSRGFQSIIFKCLKCLFKDDIVSPNTCTCTFIVRMCMDSRSRCINYCFSYCKLSYWLHSTWQFLLRHKPCPGILGPSKCEYISTYFFSVMQSLNLHQ